MLSTAKRKFRSGLWRLRRRTQPLVRRLTYTTIIERLHLAVCTPCQYDCVSCSHQGVRYQYRDYQMPLDEVRTFVHATEASGYFIDKLVVSGPGEPLLWTHLNEGLRLLRASPSIREIEILSNGLELDRLDAGTWEAFDRLVVSYYPSTRHLEDELRQAQREHPGRLSVRRIDEFTALPARATVAPIPCECQCTGPMLFDGKVFFFCGPTVFSAAASKGVDAMDYADLYTALGVGYLERARESHARGPMDHLSRMLNRVVANVDRVKKAGNHELCRYCFANSNFERPRHHHLAFYVRGERLAESVEVSAGDGGPA